MECGWCGSYRHNTSSCPGFKFERTKKFLEERGEELAELLLKIARAKPKKPMQRTGISACESIFACEYFVNEICIIEADECPRR